MDIKTYWKEQAVKAGVDPAEADTFLANDKFVKTLEAGFKPQPDYSRDLDAVRDRTRTELETKHKADITKWEEYAAKQEPKYQEYLKGLSKLQQYQAAYGELEGQRQYNADRQGGDGMLTKAEVAQMLKDERTAIAADQRQREAAYMDYNHITRDYERTFGKAFDEDGFQRFMESRPDLGGAGLKLAYKEYTDPIRSDATKAAADARAEARYQEGLRDGASRKVTPAGSGPKTFSPIFDRKADVGKLDDLAQERHSREAFIAGLNNPDETDSSKTA